MKDTKEKKEGNDNKCIITNFIIGEIYVYIMIIKGKKGFIHETKRERFAFKL